MSTSEILAFSSQLSPFGAPPPPSQLPDMPSIWNAKPRRPRRKRTSVAWDPSLDIFDDTFAFKYSSSRPFAPVQDAGLDPQIPSKQMRSSTRQSSPPAQASAVKAAQSVNSGRMKFLSALQEEHEPKLSSLSGSEESASSVEITSDKLHPLKKQPRRRTVYASSNDTTISTIHTGASLRGSPLGITRPSRVEQDLRRRRSLAVAPRKAPLQPSTNKLRQSNAVVRHVISGSGGGKENVPPGLGPKCMELDEQYTCDFKKPARRKSLGPLRHGPVYNPRQSCERVSFTGRRINSSSQTTKQVCIPSLRHSFQSSNSREHNRNSLIPAQLQKLSWFDQSHCRAFPIESNPNPSELNRPLPAKPGSPIVRLYPVLEEHVTYPELYKDDTNHQEAALTELVNKIFDKTNCRHAGAAEDGSSLQKDLISTYHDPAIVLLHTRLQASLRFGALSISKDTLALVGRYRDDLQQRQRFLDLWMKTYNYYSLQAAAEVVIGRTMPKSPTECLDPPLKIQATSRFCPKTLNGFLKTFLVYNEDSTGREDFDTKPNPTWSDKESDDFGCLAWSWRRTVIRSLMIILLLDRGQTNGKFTGCLFQSNSPFKSSKAVVQALGSLLLPPIGDINRVLDHLRYHLSHRQDLLEEQVYRVNNIAVDFRDGILLAKLVEVLAFPQPTISFSPQNIDIQFADETSLNDTFCGNGLRQHWVLSQRLKVPCVSRVQKLHNVEISLTALRGEWDLDLLLSNIKAEDIVDGHREKSVDLLWEIISKRALCTLLDFAAVEEEISRLDILHRKRITRGIGALKKFGDADESSVNCEDITYLIGLERHTLLLKRWAQKVGLLHGIAISNLSTSFTDSRAYRAIFAEYSACFQHTRDKIPSLTSSSNDRVEIVDTGSSSPSLGCSSEFIKLFGNKTTIRSARTNILLLTLLASHVLPASRPHFAAIVIQHAWRRKCARQDLRKRLKCAILARECTTVVAARERIVHAAIVLQQWWRQVCER